MISERQLNATAELQKLFPRGADSKKSTRIIAQKARAAGNSLRRRGGRGGSTSEGPSAAAVAQKPAHRAPKPPEPSGADHAGVAHVAQMFPDACVSIIKARLPRVLDALRAEGLADKPMVLSALAAVRAESPGFVPVKAAKPS